MSAVMHLGFGSFPESWLLNIISMLLHSTLRWKRSFQDQGREETVPTPESAAWAEVG